MDQVLIDSCESNGMLVRNWDNVQANQLEFWGCKGYSLFMDGVTNSMFTQLKISGGSGVPNATPGIHGLWMYGCSGNQFGVTSVERCTGSGVCLAGGCSQNVFTNLRSHDNQGWGYVETPDCNLNYAVGAQYLGNALGSMYQGGVASQQEAWCPCSGSPQAVTQGQSVMP
jgi:hypothetical protein